MKARRKREARRPWITPRKKLASPEGAKYSAFYFGLSGLVAL